MTPPVSPTVSPPHRRPLALVLLGALLLLLGACRGSRDKAESTVEERQEIEQFIESYLPHLAEAYANRSSAPLQGFAVDKERSKVEKLFADLTAQGRIVKPEVREVTVEDFSVWNHSNAFVTTFEVWDLRVYPIGSDQVLSEAIGQRNRVKYQLKRDDETGEWRVLWRDIVQTLETE